MFSTQAVCNYFRHVGSLASDRILRNRFPPFNFHECVQFLTQSLGNVFVTLGFDYFKSC